MATKAIKPKKPVDSPEVKKPPVVKATPKKSKPKKKASVKSTDKPQERCSKCTKPFKHRRTMLAHEKDCDGVYKTGGYNGGRGRDKGNLNTRTLEKIHTKKTYIDRIVAHTDQLFNAQYDKAIGEKLLFVIKTEMVTEVTSRGKTIKKEVKRTEQVKDVATIIDYLDGKLEDSDDEYYYITTEKADNKAIDSMLNRAFGKATEKVQLQDPDEDDLEDLTDDQLNKKINAYLKHRTAKD